MKEIRVYGPPGTGKTTKLLKDAENLALEFGTDKISVLSLTNSAIKEVASRNKILDFENIGTLHSRIKRYMGFGKPAEACVKQFITDCPADATEFALPPILLKRPDTGKLNEETPFAEQYLSSGKLTYYERASIYRQQMIPQDRWDGRVRDWFKVWNDWCYQTKHKDFTHWLEAAIKLNPFPRHNAVLCDEVQDFTPIQYEILRNINTKLLIMCGDDDQSLYGFAGAIPEYLFTNELPKNQEFVLEQSYRVPKLVHRYSQEWVKKIKNRKDKIYHPTLLDGFIGTKSFSLDYFKEGHLPPDFEQYLNNGKSIMILTSCGYMLGDCIETLKAKGIPFHNKHRPSNRLWNPISEIKDYVEAFFIPLNQHRLWTGNELQFWLDVLKSEVIFKEKKKTEFLNLCVQIADSIVPIETLKNYFIPDVLEKALQKDLNLFSEKNRTGPMSENWNFLLSIYEKDLKPINPQVTVGTVHSVKGGQADIVYLFPDLSKTGYFEYSGMNKDRVLRLFYVGITRAKEILTLCNQSYYYGVNW